MKILWLFKFKPNWDYNRWFHMDFAYEIAKQDNIELKSYGLGMSLGYPKLNLQSYNKVLSIEVLRQKFNFDIIIIDGKERVTYGHGRINILPQGFDKFKGCPKIVIEGDYHNYLKNGNSDWYSNRKIDLILHRHSKNVKKAKIHLPNIKHIWFPCSVNKQNFKLNPNLKRKNTLCFIGGLNCCYIYRIKAIQKLKNKKLIEVYERKLKGQKYINCLQSYVSHINGSSVFDIETAKMFEIMASGSVLFTDEFPGDRLKDLFVDGSYVTYKRDYSDLYSKAHKIIVDADYRNDITRKAVDCINQRHTHAIRIEQLLKIIKENYAIR